MICEPEPSPAPVATWLFVRTWPCVDTKKPVPVDTEDPEALSSASGPFSPLGFDAVVEGAVHDMVPCTACSKITGQDYGNATRNFFDYMAKWINARF